MRRNKLNEKIGRVDILGYYFYYRGDRSTQMSITVIQKDIVRLKFYKKSFPPFNIFENVKIKYVKVHVCCS